MEDEYTEEIDQLQQRLSSLIEAEGDKEEIRELEQQLQVLQAFYRRAVQLWTEGQRNPDYAQQLVLEGYGKWDLANVYSFIFDRATDLPPTSHSQFLKQIQEIALASTASSIQAD